MNDLERVWIQNESFTRVIAALEEAMDRLNSADHHVSSALHKASWESPNSDIKNRIMTLKHNVHDAKIAVEAEQSKMVREIVIPIFQKVEDN